MLDSQKILATVNNTTCELSDGTLPVITERSCSSSVLTECGVV